MRLLREKEPIILLFVFMVHGFEYSKTKCNNCDEQLFCNCSFKHLQHVPDVPLNARGLDLSFNQIESIRMTDLRLYTELKTLNLHKNKLTFIHKEAFKSQAKLEVLDLSLNKLENLSSCWFQELKSLQQLNLLGNPYTTLGPSPLFRFLVNLRTLQIGSHSLKEVYKNGLDELAHLDEMTVVGSSLKSYENGSFQAARPIGLVSLSLQSLFEKDPELVSKILQDVSHSETVLIIRDSIIRSNTSTEPFKASKEGGIRSLTFLNTTTTDEAITTLLLNLDGSPLSYIGLEDVHLVGQGWWQKAEFTHYENLHTVYIRNLDIQGFIKFSSMIQLAFLLKNFHKVSVINSMLFVIPRQTTFFLLHIEYLDFSQNLLTDLTIQETLFTGFGQLQNLNTLNVSQNSLKSFEVLSSLAANLKKLIHLDVSHNRFVSMPEKCHWPVTLRFLNLSNTKLLRLTPCLPSSLTVLDLSENDLKSFHQRLPKLTTLILTGNRFLNLPQGGLFPNLGTLLIQRNALRMFTRKDLSRFKNLRFLEAGTNNFLCSCEFVSFFRNHVDDLVTLRDGRRNYACDTPFSLRGDAIDSVRLSVFECYMIPAVSTLCAAIILVLIGMVVTCHKLHIIWYLQMTKAWIQAKRKPAVSRSPDELRYDAFVSYSQHDAEWVEEILVPNLENAQPPVALCLHQRDFRPGRWIVDNIIDSIEKSHRTLFVLSEHFVTSEWCRYELDFSHFRIVDEHNDSAVLILLEPIEKETIPKRFCKLRKIMNSRTYLEWPEDEDNRSEFWSNLKAALSREQC
ncbi:toll-like receptor 2 [Triplophysa rosa]|uniref:Toll-like receptor 2 n=1 Tax=Triplophysa rosa TaxID=992332 RepID=A0A977P018_TRIRA|nr:toll-like receptor 2 [Triplophysa rosa]KAI7811310.1 toll-like receptor 2 [Triplophysa rosa]UWV86650.1 Toll-like receptor 2 [Triplophysa rosa]